VSVVVDRHRAFRALLAALAAPGNWQQLPPGCGIEELLDAMYAAPPPDALAESDLPAKRIAGAERGTEVAPETGATFFLCIDDATPWTHVRVAGPGVREPLLACVPLDAEALHARNAACAEFPRGIDLVAVDGSAVVAFPRTTRIEAV
jgi:alpha-D-ribose 1-methylphosphonate 5-triphosphate synthase subunit PhnH